ncbi:MPN domain-containing protein [Vibrio owensii]|nr:MPN domain-containing protein [Vibrio owensii]
MTDSNVIRSTITKQPESTKFSNLESKAASKDEFLKSFTGHKLRKNAKKKIAQLLAYADTVMLKTQSMGMDDCFRHNEPIAMAKEDFFAWYNKEYSSMVIYLNIKEGVLQSVRFCDCIYHFSNDVVMTFSLEAQENKTETVGGAQSSASVTYSDSGLFTAHEQAALDEAAAILKSKLCISEQPALSSPEMVKNFCRYSLAAREHEVFGVIFLDNQHRVRSSEELFTGTVNAASVYPREVVKKALAENASAVIFYHNHPSGVAEPSQADRRITRRLIDALALIDVRVLDHFVVSFEDTVSFAERGWV